MKAFLRRALALGESPTTKAMNLKREGNALFKEKEYDKAAETYARACRLAVDSNLILTLRCNWALCLQRLGDYIGALTVMEETAVVCSEDDCNANPKYLYRKAVCLRHIYEDKSAGSEEALDGVEPKDLLYKARECLRKAIALCPQDKALREELKTVKGLLTSLECSEGRSNAALGGKGFDLYPDKPDWDEARAAAAAAAESREAVPVNPLPERYGAEYWQERREKWLEGCLLGQSGPVDTVSSDEGLEGNVAKDKDSGWFKWGSRDKDALADVIMEMSGPYTPLPKPFKLSMAVKVANEVWAENGY